MSAPIFLTTDEFMLILLSELPDGVYANDYANDPDVTRRSVSSSEFRALATLLDNLSQNLQLIYSDKFLSTVTAAGLSEWENDFFTTAQDATLSVDTRRQNLISKLRATGGISLPAIQSIVAGILGDIPFDLLPYSGQASIGAWILGQSLLGASTWLSALDPVVGARNDHGYVPLDCSLNYAADGLTADQLASIQTTAYTFEIRIYGNASAQTLALLDSRLTQLEPAFSTHVIRNNQVEGPSDTTAYVAATPQFARLRL